MPSVSRSKTWYVRITAPHEHIVAKYASLKVMVDWKSSFMGLHVGSRSGAQHAHIALELTSELQKQSIDERMRKLFQVDRSNYSSKPWDRNPDALSYLYHDKAVIIYNDMGVDEVSLKAKNASVQVVVEEAKKRASCKVVDSCLQAIEDSGYIWSIDRILRYILHKVQTEGMHHPQHQIGAYVRMINLRQGNEDDKKKALEAECAFWKEKIFPSSYA